MRTPVGPYYWGTRETVTAHPPNGEHGGLSACLSLAALHTPTTTAPSAGAASQRDGEMSE
ncbi:hypothetical protein GCM10018987_61120 [Streptomyces cremeus]